MSRVPESERCLHGRCHKRGEPHTWGFGFRFCEIHMPVLLQLEAGTLPPARGAVAWRECKKCRHVKRIVSRGLCTACYRHATREGILGKFSKRKPNQAIVDDCLCCAERSKLNSRGLCNTCYVRAWRRQQLHEYPVMEDQ